MEKNNNVFLAASDALVYLAEPMHKKYSAISVRGHPFSTYTYFCTHFEWPPSIPQFHTHLMDGLFLNQKTNKNSRILYSLKYKNSKKKHSLRKNKW